MSSAPKSPKEHRSFADHGAASVDEAAVSDRRDRETGVQPAQPGDAEVKQGRYGNLKENLTNRWQVLER